MADLSITAANVIESSGARINNGYKAGESVTAGQVVYLKSADSKWWKAQCDGTAEESGSGVSKGITMHAASANQPLAVMEDGIITIGATVAAGTEYYVSATAGGICPAADLTTGNYLTIVGYATTSALLKLLLHASGVTKA